MLALQHTQRVKGKDTMKRLISVVTLVAVVVILSATAVLAKPTAYTASGGGKSWSGGFLRYGFTAQVDEDGVVKGQMDWEYTQWHQHVEIMCLNVVGNTAYMSGRITKQTYSQLLFEPQYVAFYVQDNGQGDGDPADGFGGTIWWPGELWDCSNQWPWPEYYWPVTEGNIDIRESIPDGYTSQPSYSGDCTNRPPGSVCVKYSDDYIWLVYDSISGRRIDGYWGGKPIEVAEGYYHGEYFHIVGTDYVKFEPY
jgi:hypothetical protein